MRITAAAVHALSLAALLVAAGRAYGATSSADQAAAEALFSEARKLVAAGDFEHACPKFAESNRLDPGSGTLLNLGACYEKIGKLASAWGAFNEAAVTARNAGDATRQDEATRRAAALEPRLPHLVILVPNAARAAGLEVRRDGALVGEGQWGSAVPIDPGDHTVEASAPGCQPWNGTAHVGVAPGTTSVSVPLLAAAQQPAGSPGTQEPRTPSPYWSDQRIAAAALGGVGLATGVVSAALGALAMSKNNASKKDCSPGSPNLCDAAGTSLRSDAITVGNASTGAIVAAGVLLAGGIVLFATAPSRRKPEAARLEITSSIATMTLRASF